MLWYIYLHFVNLTKVNTSSNTSEKAATLLSLAIKNHSFVNGNKRIEAALFLMFLTKNRFFYSSTGVKRIADNVLFALCLMIAESNPKEKNIIIKVIVNLINQKKLI